LVSRQSHAFTDLDIFVLYKREEYAVLAMLNEKI